jgi:uncharacterized damage-inducible protein DinB
LARNLRHCSERATRTCEGILSRPPKPRVRHVNQYLDPLFGYKAWANSELFAVLATLPHENAEQLHACIRTLNHIYVVDRIFRAHLSAEQRPFDATNTKATPALEQLRADVAATDAWYRGYVSLLDPADLAAAVDFTFTDGDRGRMTKEEILLHVLTHGGYHRSNVGQVLVNLGRAAARLVHKVPSSDRAAGPLTVASADLLRPASPAFAGG